MSYLESHIIVMNIQMKGPLAAFYQLYRVVTYSRQKLKIHLYIVKMMLFVKASFSQHVFSRHAGALKARMSS